MVSGPGSLSYPHCLKALGVGSCRACRQGVVVSGCRNAHARTTCGRSMAASCSSGAVLAALLKESEHPRALKKSERGEQSKCIRRATARTQCEQVVLVIREAAVVVPFPVCFRVHKAGVIEGKPVHGHALHNRQLGIQAGSSLARRKQQLRHGMREEPGMPHRGKCARPRAAF